MVRVEDHGDTVQLSHSAHMEGTCNATGDASRVVHIVSRLPGDELAPATGEGHHDRASSLLRSLHACVDRTSADDVHARDGELVLLGVIEQVHERLACHHARFHRRWHLREAGLLQGRRHGTSHARRRRRAHRPLSRTHRTTYSPSGSDRPASTSNAAALLFPSMTMLQPLLLLLLLLAEVACHLTGRRGREGGAECRSGAIGTGTRERESGHPRRHFSDLRRELRSK
mmetsp:Transcript_74046/g.187270  ORF Transcript_74046/g.187270 Transcript_74046/m.187270 type:complete len:228 (-) Transcript_74046:122-805(-)